MIKVSRINAVSVGHCVFGQDTDTTATDLTIILLSIKILINNFKENVDLFVPEQKFVLEYV